MRREDCRRWPGGGRILRVLAACLVAATTPVGAPALAEGETVQFRAVDDLWGKVRANCDRPDGGYIVDHFGFPARGGVGSAALRNIQFQKLEAAFSKVLAASGSGGQRANLKPIEQDELRAHVYGDAFEENAIVDRFRDTYLLATADLVADAKGQYLLSVTVRGLGGSTNGCFEASDLYPLPEEEVGEPVVSLADIFGRAASKMIDRSKGKVTVYLSAEVVGEGQAPGRWTDTFVDEMRYAVQTAREKSSTINLSDSTASILVQPQTTGASPAGERWVSDVKIERKRNAYRVVLTVDPNADYIVEPGLVQPSELPDIPVEQLRDVNYGAGRTKLLNIVGEQQVVLGMLPGATDVQDYGFRLSAPAYVEFDIAGNPGEPPPLDLYNGSGALVEPIASRSPTLRRFRLGADTYRLRVRNTKGPRAGYRLSYRGSEQALAPMLPPDFRITRVFRDWQVGIGFQKGERACFAVTEATRWSPAGWRPIRPFIWFLVPDSKASEASERVINQRFDVAAYYDTSVPLQGHVFGNKENWSIPIGIRDQQIQSVVGGDIMSLESLEGLTQGTALVLEGATAEQRPAQIEYSLSGYQAAINEILSECNRLDLRAALIRR